MLIAVADGLNVAPTSIPGVALHLAPVVLAATLAATCLSLIHI